MKKYYANIIDLSEIPEPVLQLAMSDWFDKTDIITGDNGNEIFIPADSATQSTMNACGYENVC